MPELIDAGYQVLGMARSDEGARALVAAGAQVHRGNLEDLESLRSAAARADGVIHAAFDHDFSNFAANCQKDRCAIEALGAALAGSKRPLVITSGTGMGNAVPGQPATEDVFNASHPNPRSASELAGASVSAAGVNVSVVRLAQVHNTVKQGLITPLIELTRKKESPPMSATAPTDGRRRTSWMSLASIGWRWRSRKRAAGITRWLKKACRSERSRRSSDEA